MATVATPAKSSQARRAPYARRPSLPSVRRLYWLFRRASGDRRAVLVGGDAVPDVAGVGDLAELVPLVEELRLAVAGVVGRRLRGRGVVQLNRSSPGARHVV